MTRLSVSTLSASDSFLSTAGSSAEGGVTVDLDASLFVQLGLFIVLLLVLKPLLFEPMLKLFEERDARTEGKIAGAGKLDAKSAQALAKYEAALAKAREAGTAESNALRADGAKKEAILLADVRAATAKTLDSGRSAMNAEARLAREQLRADASVLGRDIASRVLGREITS